MHHPGPRLYRQEHHSLLSIPGSHTLVRKSNKSRNVVIENKKKSLKVLVNMAIGNKGHQRGDILPSFLVSILDENEMIENKNRLKQRKIKVGKEDTLLKSTDRKSIQFTSVERYKDKVDDYMRKSTTKEIKYSYKKSETQSMT